MLAQLIQTCGFILVLCGLVIAWVVFSESGEPERKKARLAALPGQISTALANAQKATEACLGMCEAAALAEALTLSGPAEEILKELRAHDGPTEGELLVKKQATSIKTIERCRCLAVEGVKLTTDKNYCELRGIFQAAEAACRSCKPVAGQEKCQALDFLIKVSLT